MFCSSSGNDIVLEVRRELRVVRENKISYVVGLVEWILLLSPSNLNQLFLNAIL